MRAARIAGLAVARTDPRNAMPPKSSRRSHGTTNAACSAKKRRYRSYERATPNATPNAMPDSAMNESSNKNDFRTMDLRNPIARSAPVSCRRHVHAGSDLEVERARTGDCERLLEEVSGHPEPLDELLVEDPDDPDAAGRRPVAVVERVANGRGQDPEIGAEVVGDHGA